MITRVLTHAIFSIASITISFQDAGSTVTPKATLAPRFVSTSIPAEKHQNFSIENYRMQHHHSFQTLNIAVDYSSEPVRDLPNFLTIYHEISQFLRHYPNENDYWEIINRDLTDQILQQHPELSSISITLEVLPTERLPYTRASVVTRSHTGAIAEGWRLSARVPVQLHGNVLNYEAEYVYRDGITNTEYPDFIPIHDRLTQLLTLAVVKGDPWEYTTQDIATSMLQKYPALDSFTSRINISRTGLRTRDEAAIALLRSQGVRR